MELIEEKQPALYIEQQISRNEYKITACKASHYPGRLLVEPVYKRILFSSHAIVRMFQRGIVKDEVLSVIKEGETIGVYPDDTPYPSKLLLGFIGDTPLHVILAEDRDTHTGIVVTAYVPESSLWTDDYRNRR